MFILPHLGLQDLDEWWQGLCLSRIHQSILAVAQQLVGLPMPGRFAVKQPISPSELLGLGIGMTCSLVETTLFQNPRKIGDAMTQVLAEAL
jgi:hypothetical protein